MRSSSVLVEEGLDGKCGIHQGDHGWHIRAAGHTDDQTRVQVGSGVSREVHLLFQDCDLTRVVKTVLDDSMEEVIKIIGAAWDNLS
jgi:hypothetical protein